MPLDADDTWHDSPVDLEDMVNKETCDRDIPEDRLGDRDQVPLDDEGYVQREDYDADRDTLDEILEDTMVEAVFDVVVVVFDVVVIVDAVHDKLPPLPPSHSS